jgi:aminocarboxymuconate-semialdehyde decarboxylase
MTDVEGSVAEARRAVKGSAPAASRSSPAWRRPLDDPAFEPIFATMAELDLPVWLHPARTASMPDYPAEPKSRFEMWWCFGWPYDTSVAMVRMVFSGLLDRYPGLKIITHHLGGMIPYYDGRVGPGLQVLGSRTSDEDYSNPALAEAPHLDYLHDFYGDTALFGGGIQAVRCGLEFFGADHVVLRPTPRSVRSRRPSTRSGGSTSPRRSAQDLRRQRRAASEDEVVLKPGETPCRGMRRCAP